MGEYVRRAAEAYDPEAEHKALEGLVQRVRESADEAERAMDEALASVSKSRKRIADMEAAHSARKAA